MSLPLIYVNEQRRIYPYRGGHYNEKYSLENMCKMAEISHDYEAFKHLLSY